MVEIIGDLNDKRIHDLRPTLNAMLAFTDCICDFLKASLERLHAFRVNSLNIYCAYINYRHMCVKNLDV